MQELIQAESQLREISSQLRTISTDLSVLTVEQYHLQNGLQSAIIEIACTLTRISKLQEKV